MMSNVDKLRIINRTDEIEKLLYVLNPNNIFEQRMIMALQSEIRDIISLLENNAHKKRLSKFKLIEGGNGEDN